MGAVVSVIFKRGEDTFTMDKYTSLNEIEVETIDGQKTTIGNMVAGAKLYIIVNVASK